MTDVDRRDNIRWWPLAVILVLTVASLIFVWASEARHRQDRVIQTFRDQVKGFVVAAICRNALI